MISSSKASKIHVRLIQTLSDIQLQEVNNLLSYYYATGYTDSRDSVPITNTELEWLEDYDFVNSEKVKPNQVLKNNTENFTLSGLYYKYGKKDDEYISDFLEKIQITHFKKGQYHELTNGCLEKLKNKKRKVSLTFDVNETYLDPIFNLVEYKRITYLVKSSSRFFLKPDIGEIIDQIKREEFGTLKAICFDGDNYQTLPNTEAEHFLMTVGLLKEIL